MGSDLCIGIASKNETLEITALEPGNTVVSMRFPATGMGLEAIKIFLADYGDRVRMAVSGVAALGVALKVGNAPQREVFIVSSAIVGESLALAHYAERSI